MKFSPGLFFLLFLLFFTGTTTAQNYFPNGGFEQYNQCPTYSSQINRCTGWDSCLGTADFYHCGYYGPSTLGSYGIPSTGSGVAGLIAAVPGPWTQPPGRFYGETFRGILTRPLEPGATYRIQADILYNTVQMPPPGDCLDVGFYFFKSSNPPAYPASPAFSNQYKAMVGIPANAVPVGTHGTFTLTYVADSCYDQVMVGLFQNDSTFGATCFNSASSFYFNIDNISMIQTAAAPVRITSAVSSLQNICIDDCIDFNANANLPVYTWSWEFPGAETTTSQQQNPTGICYQQPGQYDVNLITTYECSSDTTLLEDYISVEDVPVVSIQADTTINCFGKSILLTANSDYPVVWNTGQQSNEIHTTFSGKYIAVSENECGSDSDSINIVFENCPCTVYLPNAFSPDEDGNNDYFKAEGDCPLQDFQLDVFDRWGKRVFTASNIQSAWDGKYNGEVCPQGVYGVTLTYSGYSDYRLKKQQKSGYVVVVR